MLAEALSPVALEALEAEGSVHRIIGFHPRCCPLPSSSKPFSYLYVRLGHLCRMDLWILCLVAVAMLAFHQELVYLPFEA